MSQKIEQYSRWVDSDGNHFQIIHVITDEQGHEWVHYRREKDALEYSCWTDSFLARFSSVPHNAASHTIFGFKF